MFAALIGPVLKGIFSIIDSVIENKADAGRLKTEIARRQLEFNTTELRGAIRIILAEATGSWLQKNWRPMLMLIIMLIVANNYLLFPYLSMFTNKVVVLDLPDKLWTLMIVGVGGYVGGRTLEKSIKTWKNPDK